MRIIAPIPTTQKFKVVERETFFFRFVTFAHCWKVGGVINIYINIFLRFGDRCTLLDGGVFFVVQYLFWPTYFVTQFLARRRCVIPKKKKIYFVVVKKKRKNVISYSGNLRKNIFD